MKLKITPRKLNTDTKPTLDSLGPGDIIFYRQELLFFIRRHLNTGDFLFANLSDPSYVDLPKCDGEREVTLVDAELTWEICK